MIRARLQRLAFIATLVLTSTVVAFGCAEALLRFTDYRTLLYVRTVPPGYYQSAEGGYDIRPNVAPVRHTMYDSSYEVWSNSLGCFDNPYRNEQPYILLVGDSFTWGYAPFADKWGTRLESYLGTRVLKCGVPGYGTRQELLKAQRLLSALPAPQAIIVGYFVNDYSDDRAPELVVVDGDLMPNLGGTSDPARLREIRHRAEALMAKYCTTYEPAHPAFQRVKCVLRQHSIVYALAISVAKKRLARPLRRAGIVNTPPDVVAGVTPTAERQQQHFQNVLDFKRFADEKGVQLLFVMIPSQEMVASDADGHEFSDVESFMASHGISYLDPLPDLRAVSRATKRSLYWREDHHLDERGNHLLGMLVARRLLNGPHDAGLRARVDSDLAAEFSYKAQ